MWWWCCVSFSAGLRMLTSLPSNRASRIPARRTMRHTRTTRGLTAAGTPATRTAERTHGPMTTSRRPNSANSQVCVAAVVVAAAVD